MNSSRIRRPFMLAGPAAALALAGSAAAVADGLASPWVEGFNNKARLLAGRAERAGDKGERLYGAIEIAMPAGWKTYWRAPGDAGGIPPEFDFSGSQNAADIEVLYPAPHRLIDKSGTTIGYKDHIILPIALAPIDAGKPVELKLKAAYGVCEKLCVPAEVELELTITPDAGASSEIADVLLTVPRVSPIQGTDPLLAKWRVETRDTKPYLVIDMDDPGQSNATAEGAEAFVESPKGVYLPVPKKLSQSNGRSVFEVDLTDGAEIKELGGLPVRITLIGSKGQSETTITLP